MCRSLISHRHCFIFQSQIILPAKIGLIEYIRMVLYTTGCTTWIRKSAARIVPEVNSAGSNTSTNAIDAACIEKVPFNCQCATHYYYYSKTSKK